MTNTCIDPESADFEIVANVPLVLRAELDRKIVSIRELMGFEEGTIVPLSRPAGENVDLYASEVYIGSCEILVIDGALAVRLADIANDTAPESQKPSVGRSTLFEILWYRQIMSTEKQQMEAMSELSEFRGEEVVAYTPAAGNSPMLQRLMEIEMPMAVALGRAVLPIHDILRMSSGSLIELDRNVGEYVELMVHGTVVARGEIVSVKGNYGVRIKEIMSRQERLALKA